MCLRTLVGFCLSSVFLGASNPVPPAPQTVKFLNQVELQKLQEPTLSEIAEIEAALKLDNVDPVSLNRRQNVFVAFRNTEAPVFVGDAIWNQRLSTPNTIEGAAAGTAAHMKVITREAGGQYRAIGGNEGKYSTVNDVPVEVDADKLLTGRAKTLYAVVYKRVTVVGSEGGGETMASN